MSYRLNVHFLPELTHPHALAGNTVVVIDVLRASTTIIHALASRAIEVIPCLEVEEARSLARRRGTNVILGGERGGKPISGFDLGNSPTAYSPDRVAGRTVVFTTTNGTRALTTCTGAARVLISAFVNLNATAVSLADEPAIDLLCAGTEQNVTREDVLFAGALAGRLITFRGEPASMNDQTRIAVAAWQQVADISATLLDSQGGRNLASIGLQADVDFAAKVDYFPDCVPHLDRSLWSIRLP